MLILFIIFLKNEIKNAFDMVFFFYLFTLQQEYTSKMGCGAVCGLQPATNNYQKYSKKCVQQLFSQLKISKPFLSQKRYQHFAQVLRDKNQNFIIKVSEVLEVEEDVEESIMQKWKVLLYGIDKSDEIYKRCLSFQVRNQKQIVTNDQKVIKNNSSLINNSYHEIKPNPQYHECFEQIEKDLNRTFEFKIEKKQIFQNVLKRISNYFPSMGYTQGVNFIVGYLLVLGYSQSDTFWMFIHLAINKRYLILGMYEDGFPLTYIYTLIFKNMLRRKDPQLYNHFFNNLILDQSMWVFKWFITYYIYSFPFSLIKHIWNLVIQIGGLALVYFAVCLTLNLRKELLLINDPCDMSEFLQTLKDHNTLNKLVKINKVIESSYQQSVIYSDFEGLNQLKPSFYKQYYKVISDKLKQGEKIKLKRQNDDDTQGYQLKDKQSNILHQWYAKLLVERMQFQKRQQSQKLTEKSIRIPESMKSQYEDLQKSLHMLQQKIIKNQSMKLSKKLIKENPHNNDFFDDLLYQDSYEIKPRDHMVPVNQIGKKCSTKISYQMNIQAQINQVQQFSDSNNEQIEQNLENMKQEQSYFNDELAQRNIGDYQLKIQTKYQLKVNNLVGQINSNPKRYNHKELAEKANNIKPYIEEKKKGFCLAGQSILNNLSIANSHHSSSISSNNNNFKPKKQKQNILRTKVNKIKTQQKSQPSIEPSENESSNDRQTQKEAFSRIVKRQATKTSTQTELDYTNSKNKLKTQLEFMMNNSHSHKPAQGLHENSFNKESQIQIFNGSNLFKKKKKIQFRNSNEVSISTNLNDLPALSENRNGFSRKNQMNRQKLKITDQQSLQSIIYPLSRRNQLANKNLVESYEIQSVEPTIDNL